MPRLVIVEDEAPTRNEVARTIAQQKGWQVVGAHANGESAMACIAAERPDIVMLDIGLPGISGLDCLIRLKFEHPQVVFVMFTVYDDDDKLFMSLRLGASGYILKGEGLSEIVRALRYLEKGQSYMSPTIATKVVQSFWRENVDIGDFQKLSNRQLQLVRLVSEGLAYRDVGEEMGITEGGVRQHLNRIYRLFHINNRLKLAKMYQELMRKLGPPE